MDISLGLAIPDWNPAGELNGNDAHPAAMEHLLARGEGATGIEEPGRVPCPPNVTLVFNGCNPDILAESVRIARDTLQSNGSRVIGVAVSVQEGGDTAEIGSTLAALPERLGGLPLILEANVPGAWNSPAKLREALLGVWTLSERPLAIGLRFQSRERGEGLNPFPWIRAFGRALRYIVLPVHPAIVPEMVCNALFAARVRRCTVYLDAMTACGDVKEELAAWAPALAVASLGAVPP